MKKLTSLLALVLAIAMLICACGGNNSTTGTTAATNGTTAGNTTGTTASTKPTTGTTGTTGTTSTTQKPDNTTTGTVTPDPDDKSIKILAIGNSFSVDAMQHLGVILKAAGYEEIVLGNLYIGGCSLDQHLTNAKGGGKVYEFYTLSADTNYEWKSTTQNLDTGLVHDDWDYITVQQVSQNSGMPDTYGALNELLDYVLENHLSTDPKIYWHMTWAYEQDSSHAGFANYDKDQMKMYNAIVETVKSKILTNDKIDGVIASGTAIQNLRTSYMGDALTRDGYHLTYDIGRYTAALLWYKTLTGRDITDLAAIPEDYPNIMEHLPAIKEAVNNAVANPYTVTESTHKEFVNELLVMTDADKAHLTNLGLNPDNYEVLDLGLTFRGYWNSSSTKVTLTTTAANSGQFFATKIFTPQTLPVGSVVNIADGFQYRPEGWVKFGTANAGNVRPANATADFIVDETFYSTFAFRAFNVCHVAVDGVVADVIYDDRTALRIYVPKAEEPSTALTDEDKAYLAGIGLNPDNYIKVDLGYTLYSYYNSTSSTTSTLLCLASGSTANNLHNFISTRLIEKAEIPNGSIIRIDNGFQYRPERFVAIGTKPSARGSNTTTAYVVVDDAWWGTHNYVGFNVAVKGNSATVSMATGDEFVVYALKAGATPGTPDPGTTPEGPKVVDSKVADEVFAGFGYDATKYTKVTLQCTLRAYYNSLERTSIIMDKSNCPQFWATQIFNKADLPNGTVIVIGKGYQYRPDGWQTLDANNTSARPGNVIGSEGNQIVVVDDAWWGDLNHRGFNIAVEGNSVNVTEADYVTFAIYIPKA